MRNYPALGLAALLTLFSSPAFAADRSDDVVNVGAILPLSGEAASWGQAVQNGMTLALESLDPAARAKLKIVYEDDSLSPRNSLSALNKLLASGPVDAIINMSSGTGMALAPVTEEHKLPLLAVGASNGAVSRGRKYAFNFWVAPETEVRMMLPEMARRGYKRISWIGTIQDGVLAVKSVIKSETQGKTEIVLDEDFPPQTKDFRTYLAKLRLKENQTDAAMVLLLPGQLGVFARQYRDAGIRLPLFGFESMEDLNEIKAADGALTGAWFVSAADVDESFLAAYKKRFPEASSYLAGNGYDAVRLLAAAANQGTGREDIRNFFSSVKDFHGTLGTYSATGDQWFSLPASVKVITANGIESVR
jgi:branched-chain amino acid transport system substrate-binding protein